MHRVMWSTLSPAACFVARRRAFLKRLNGPAALGSGLRRVRNFEANPYPFRADSHFLYFTGLQLEGAVLYFNGEEVTLFAEPPDPGERLWHGPAASLTQLEDRLCLPVRPLEEFQPDPDTAAIPSPDSDSALWLEELLGRTIELEPDMSRVPHRELDPEEHGDELLARALVDQRLCHDEYAIEQLRQAAQVTVAAHRAGLSKLVVGRRAADVRAFIEAEMTSSGMVTAYGSIVTPQGNILHARTSEDVLEQHDWLLVDAGAETPEGWAADVTRTWPLSGRFAGFAAELYGVVLLAQEAAIAACTVGTRFLDVHRVASQALSQGLIEAGVVGGSVEELVESGVVASLFPHGVGHLLGLDVHDMEDLGDRAGYPEGRTRSLRPAERFLRLDRVLQPGMVVTIEPGLYNLRDCMTDREALERLDRAMLKADEFHTFRGIRIEDDVLITSGGPEVLSAALPKKPAEVEQLLQAQRK